MLLYEKENINNMKQIKRVTIYTILALFISMPNINANAWSIVRGEHLKYKISFYSGITGNVKGGDASLRVAPNLVTTNGSSSYHATMQGGTSGVIEWIYRVENRYESFIDTKSGTPNVFKQFVSENKYSRQDSIVFDHKNLTAKNISRNETTKIKPKTHDFVSMIYYVRSLDVSKLKKGDSFVIPFYTSGKVIESKVVFAGIEEITVNNKKVKCYAYKPELPEGKLFKQDYPATIWFSTDSKRLPMMIEARMKVGRIKMELLSSN